MPELMDYQYQERLSAFRREYFAAPIILMLFTVLSLSFTGSIQAQQPEQFQKTLRDALENEKKRRHLAELAALKKHFKALGVEASKKGIQQYIKQIMGPNPDRSALKKLVVQLGADQYSQRVAAEQSLMKLPVLPMDLLQEASRSEQPEQAIRARRILTYTSAKMLHRFEQALRAIELLKIPGMAKEVLAIAKFQSDRQVGSTPAQVPGMTESRKELLNRSRSALRTTVTSEDLPLLISLIDNDPLLRNLAIHALSSNMFSSEERVRKLLDKVWSSDQPWDRFASAQALLARGDREALGRFVTLLETDDLEIRALAAIRLWRSTGQLLPFDAKGKPQKRLKQIAAWRSWIDEFEVDTPIRTEELSLPRTRGRTLVASTVNSEVKEYDLAGNETWRVRLVNASRCWGLETGERVVNSWNASALIVYAAGDGPPRELWRLNERCHAGPLPDGGMLVWNESGRIRRYDGTGNEIWETKEIFWNGKKITPLEADLLPNGNIRILFCKFPGWFARDTAIEIDKQGVVLRQLAWNDANLFQRLPNGNELVHVRGGAVAEYNPAGKVVWTYRLDDHSFESAQRLPNGDTLVADRRSLVPGALRVIRPDGKTIVWELKLGHHVSHVYRY